MKRCTHCRRFTAGDPTYCPYCGHTYNVRLCPRGHRNPRGTAFCRDCGSGELSTPGPPETLGSRLTTWLLKVGAIFLLALAALAVVASVLQSLDGAQLVSDLFPLLLLLTLLSWLVSQLPGPVKRVGRSIGRRIGQAVKSNAKRK